MFTRKLMTINGGHPFKNDTSIKQAFKQAFKQFINLFNNTVLYRGHYGVVTQAVTLGIMQCLDLHEVVKYLIIPHGTKTVIINNLSQ